MRLICPFESNDFGAEGLIANGSGVSISTTFAKTGSRSLKLVVAGGAATYVTGGALAAGNLRNAQFHIRVTSLPSSDRGLINPKVPFGRLNVQLGADGKLRVYDGFPLAGTSTTALTDPTRWYHICLRYTGTVLELRIDGVTEISYPTGAGPLPDPHIGADETGAGAYTCYIDNLILDDTTGFYTGITETALLLPVEDVQRGFWTGGGGGTTNLFEGINNTPPLGSATLTDANCVKNLSPYHDTGSEYLIVKTNSFTSAGVTGTIKTMSSGFIATRLTATDTYPFDQLGFTPQYMGGSGVLLVGPPGEYTGVLGFPSQWRRGSSEAYYSTGDGSINKAIGAQISIFNAASAFAPTPVDYPRWQVGIPITSPSQTDTHPATGGDGIACSFAGLFVEYLP